VLFATRISGDSYFLIEFILFEKLYDLKLINHFLSTSDIKLNPELEKIIFRDHGDFFLEGLKKQALTLKWLDLNTRILVELLRIVVLFSLRFKNLYLTFEAARAFSVQNIIL
jgi:hypothetical protein